MPVESLEPHIMYDVDISRVGRRGSGMVRDAAGHTVTSAVLGVVVDGVHEGVRTS